MIGAAVMYEQYSFTGNRCANMPSAFRRRLEFTFTGSVSSKAAALYPSPLFSITSWLQGEQGGTGDVTDGGRAVP